MDGVKLPVDDSELRQEFARFMMRHRFAMEEVVTKLTILRDEFAMLHEENPIEHVASRLKSPDSLAEKMARKGTEPTFASISETITDLAGVRVTCSFISDVYRVFDLLTTQSDITVMDVRDYIEQPKANGYRSLHALIQVPVFLSDGPVPVTVEVQFRTIAMDFWAALEHKIHYKFRGAVPDDLADRLCDAADAAHALDTRMKSLHDEVLGVEDSGTGPLPTSVREGLLTGTELQPSDALLEQLRRLNSRD